CFIASKAFANSSSTSTDIIFMFTSFAFSAYKLITTVICMQVRNNRIKIKSNVRLTDGEARPDEYQVANRYRH
ncbi:MAG: hypothetical protein KAT65_27055, partial [Methanophagales archaeon]|nr:hypothetical protein [Methanophagales archaeon]